MRRVLILSAYGYSWEAAEETTTCRGFLRGLAAAGWRRGSEVEVEIHHAPRRSDHRRFLQRRLAGGEPLDLVYTGSASLMEVARDALAAGPEVPLLYWGSHIVDEGRLINPLPAEPFVAGLRLDMPLYCHHRQFRLLKELFPELREIYTPFSVDSAFYHPEMARRHARAVARRGPACWVDAGGEHGGFPGLAKLADIIDARFFEHPCADAATLVEAVEGLPAGEPGRPATRILLNGIECFHVPGANEALVEAADRRGIPYVGLNFGRFHGPRGPLAIFTNDIEAAAHRVGTLAARVLAGTAPSDLGVQRNNVFRFAYNDPNSLRRKIQLSTAARGRIARHFEPLEGPLDGSPDPHPPPPERMEPPDAGPHGDHRRPLRLDPEDPPGAGGP